jgi:hypothetical protein
VITKRTQKLALGKFLSNFTTPPLSPRGTAIVQKIMFKENQLKINYKYIANTLWGITVVKQCGNGQI